MNYARVTGSGQVTIPSELRKRHQIHKGDMVLFQEDEAGRIYLAQPGAEFLSLKGILKQPAVTFEDDDDFDKAIDYAFEQGLAEEYRKDDPR